MSETENPPEDIEANTNTDTGSEPETREYEVLSGSVDGKGPGETVELAPQFAESFDVMPADADRSSEAVRSQLIGAGRGMTTLADLPPGETIEAGEYEVYQDAIGRSDGVVEPGQTDHFDAATARAFADNLLAPGENGDTSRDAQSEGVMMDELNSPDETPEIPVEEEAVGESFEEQNPAEQRAFDTPEEFLEGAGSIENLRTELDSADLDDNQLDKLLDAEQAGEDRTGAKDAIRDRMSNTDDSDDTSDE